MMSDKTKPSEEFDELEIYASLVALYEFGNFMNEELYAHGDSEKFKYSPKDRLSVAQDLYSIVNHFSTIPACVKNKVLCKFENAKKIALCKMLRHFLDIRLNESKESQDVKKQLISEFNQSHNADQKQ